MLRRLSCVAQPFVMSLLLRYLGAVHCVMSDILKNGDMYIDVNNRRTCNNDNGNGNDNGDDNCV
jgi:hypothetical protein